MKTVSDDEKQEKLVLIIKAFLEPCKACNYNVSSYELKHVLEDIAGFYVSEDDCVAAMKKAGFEAREPSFVKGRWFFNATVNSIRRLYRLRMRGVVLEVKSVREE